MVAVLQPVIALPKAPADFGGSNTAFSYSEYSTATVRASTTVRLGLILHFK